MLHLTTQRFHTPIKCVLQFSMCHSNEVSLIPSLNGAIRYTKDVKRLYVKNPTVIIIQCSLGAVNVPSLQAASSRDAAVQGMMHMNCDHMCGEKH